MLKRALVLLATAIGLLAAAGPASAANTVALQGDVMKVEFTEAAALVADEGGSTVTVSVSFFAPSLFDSAQSPCTLNPERTVASCPAAQTASVAVATGAGADELHVGVLTRPIRWDAGAGNDTANISPFSSGSSSPPARSSTAGPERTSSSAARDPT